MRTFFFAVLISTLALPGCSSIRDSRINPVNWFGSDDTSAATEPEASDNPLIPVSTGIFSSDGRRDDFYGGSPIQTVTEVTLERVPGGLLIRATGVSLTQGAYDVRLTPVSEDENPQDGVLAYRLEAMKNEDIAAQGTIASRTVTVARKLTDQELGDTRIVRVSGVQNTVEARRR